MDEKTKALLNDPEIMKYMKASSAQEMVDYFQADYGAQPKFDLILNRDDEPCLKITMDMLCVGSIGIATVNIVFGDPLQYAQVDMNIRACLRRMARTLWDAKNTDHRCERFE